MLPVVIAFSLISGKADHYLIPVFPAFGLHLRRAPFPAMSAVAAGCLHSLQHPLPQCWHCLRSPLCLHSESTARVARLWPALLLMPAVAAPALGLWSARARSVLPERAGDTGRALTVALIQGPAVTQFPFGLRHVGRWRWRSPPPVKRAPGGERRLLHDQFHFAGRLRPPLVALRTRDDG